MNDWLRALSRIFGWLAGTPGYIAAIWVVGWAAYIIIHGGPPVHCTILPEYRIWYCGVGSTLLPVAFIGVIALSLLRALNPGSTFQGETEEHPYTSYPERLKEPEPEPEPVTENCKNCGGPNVNRVTCQYCGLVLD